MKKILLSTVMVTVLFAGNSDYAFEVTPTIGGVWSQNSLGLKSNHLNYGIRFGYNLENSWIDQIEGGFDFASGAKYKNTGLKTDIYRYSVNAIKEYAIAPKFDLYGLVGLGYKDVQHSYKKNQDSMFANYGVGAKYKMFEQFWLKADVKHAINFKHGTSEVLYTLGFTVPFGKRAPKEVVTAPVEDVVVVQEEVIVVVDNDYDKDGVTNDKDLCPNTPIGVKVDANGCPKVVTLEVNFAFNSFEIAEKYMPEIRKAGDFLMKNPDYSAVLKGYTDSIGTDAYNMVLSERRAQSVMQALEVLGVNPDQLKAIGYGKSDPIATNETSEGRAQNRRVDAEYNHK